MTQSDLNAILKRIHKLGYWQGDSQQAFGVTDISMPIMGPDQRALAVLTCPFIRHIDRHVGPDIGATRVALKQATVGLSIG